MNKLLRVDFYWSKKTIVIFSPMTEDEFLYLNKSVKRFRLLCNKGEISMVLGDDIIASTEAIDNIPLLRKSDVEEAGRIPFAIYVKIEECGGFCSWCVGPKCKYYGVIELDESRFVKVLYKVWQEES